MEEHIGRWSVRRLGGDTDGRSEWFVNAVDLPGCVVAPDFFEEHGCVFGAHERVVGRYLEVQADAVDEFPPKRWWSCCDARWFSSHGYWESRPPRWSAQSPQGGWSDTEADRSGAGVEAVIPHRDREICGADRESAGEMNGVRPTKPMSRRERPGGPLNIG